MIGDQFKIQSSKFKVREARSSWVLLLVGFVALTTVGRAAEPITLSSSVSATQVTVGDQFTYTLTAEWEAAKVEIVEPQFDEKLGPFEILKVQDASQRHANPTYKQTVWTVTLAAFDAGEHAIPAISISYKLNDKTEKKAEFKAVKVKVLSGLDPTMKAGEAFGPKPTVAIAPDPRYRNRLLVLGAVILLVAVIAAYVIWRIRNRPTSEVIAAIEDHRSPEQIAFDELDALVSSGLMEQGNMKAFYTALGDILRAYLGRKYNFLALDMTTSETMDFLTHRISSVSITSRIEELLNEADLAKFAKWKPTRETCERSIETAKRLIDDLMVLTAPKTEAEVVGQ